MAEDQAAGVPPAAGTAILALGAGAAGTSPPGFCRGYAFATPVDHVRVAVKRIVRMYAAGLSACRYQRIQSGEVALRIVANRVRLIEQFAEADEQAAHMVGVS